MNDRKDAHWGHCWANSHVEGIADLQTAICDLHTPSGLAPEIVPSAEDQEVVWGSVAFSATK